VVSAEAVKKSENESGGQKNQNVTAAVSWRRLRAGAGAQASS
jgi:hypothetical protein